MHQLRLPQNLRQQLDSCCKACRVTKTHVITELLSDHLSTTSRSGKTPYELAREFGLVGGFSSGKDDLATNRKQVLVGKLRAKHSR